MPCRLAASAAICNCYCILTLVGGTCADAPSRKLRRIVGFTALEQIKQPGLFCWLNKAMIFCFNDFVLMIL